MATTAHGKFASNLGLGLSSTIQPSFTGAGLYSNTGGARQATEVGQAYSDRVQTLLGAGAKVTAATSYNLDTREGYARSTTGIPYAISGTATVVSQTVGEWLASYPDPLKAILPMGLHKDRVIQIKRRYVVGGNTTIVPERAPARTVALQEDVREVTLTRYGGDLEMNLNLFLRPGDAQEELDLKLGAQKRELANRLTEIAYETVMREGTNVVEAIIRSTPKGSSFDQKSKAAHANRIYATNIFGALNKSAYGISSLLAACRYASAYTTGTQRGSVMIIPHGVPDILRYARREAMTYSVSGFESGKNEGKKGIDMQMEDAYVCNSSGVKIMVHYPTPHYDSGTHLPEVRMGGLTREVWVVSKHVVTTDATDRIPDPHNGGFIDPTLEGGRSDGGNAGTLDTAYVYFRVNKCIATSALIAAPGQQTGEMLVGYPFTGVSTSHSEERLRIQLRCYLGCAIYNPDNILIMPNAFIESVGPSALFKVAAAKATSDAVAGTEAHDENSVNDAELMKMYQHMLEDTVSCASWTDKTKVAPALAKCPRIMIRDGAVFNEGGVAISVNNGEFGRLDHPTDSAALHGAPQVMDDRAAGFVASKA